MAGKKKSEWRPLEERLKDRNKIRKTPRPPLTPEQLEERRLKSSQSQRAWAARNREYVREKTRERRAKLSMLGERSHETGPQARALKAWYEEYKTTNSCVDCNTNYPSCCMDFDHRPGESKSYNVASMVSSHARRELIDVEVAKCDLICSNCHRIRTRDRKRASSRYYKEKQELTI